MDKVTAFAGAVGRRVLNLFVLKSHEFGGSWGGTECAAYLPLRTHLLEASFFCWTLAAIFAVFRLGHRFSDHYMIVKINMMSMQYRSHWLERTVDKTLSAILLGMYLMLIYYKFNCSSLVSLSQPCHVIMLLEGLALASDGPAGTVITTYLLPALSGTFLALLFPDTTGLDQPFEELSYWVQHYLIIVVPVYLLTRRNGLALALSSRDTVAFGLWLLTFVHYTFYESMDLLLQVNVEFMLCPTAPMRTIFALLPSFVTWPSYRMPIFAVVAILGPTIAYIFMALARLAMAVKGVFSRRAAIAHEANARKVTEYTKRAMKKDD